MQLRHPHDAHQNRVQQERGVGKHHRKSVAAYGSRHGWAALQSTFTLTILLFSASTARAQSDMLHYDPTVDLPVTFAASAVWLGGSTFQDDLAPKTCGWCERKADGTDTVNELDASVRRNLKWSNTTTADTASNITGFALLPLGAVGLTALGSRFVRQPNTLAVDLLVITEATMISMDLNLLVKYAVGRERPFVHILPAEEKASTNIPSDNYTSFYSGHTAFAFTLAVSSATVATMRGYGSAPWLWAYGLSMAATTGYLRIAADRHYFTDVVTGAMVGSAIGFAVPYLLHRPRKGVLQHVSMTAMPLSGGTMLLANVIL